MRIGASFACIVLLCAINCRFSMAQSEPPGIPHWAAVVHGLAMKAHDPEPPSGSPGVFPPIIPKFLRNDDPTGTVETYNLAAPTHTSTNPFFQVLGTNGRACATCHEPRSAWGVSAASIQQRFDASDGTDPIFRLVDGATCDHDDVSSLSAKRQSYSLLLSNGLIRVFLPLPATQLGSNPPVPRDYEILSVDDRYGCTNLSSDPPIVSVYRRPLPSANLKFLLGCADGDPSCAHLSIMWDGREPSLQSQVTDATLGHAQAVNPPTNDQIAQIVSFETQIFDAQIDDNTVGHLDDHGGNGGPVFLSNQPFTIGVNDSLTPGAFDDNVFTLFDAWANPKNSDGRDAARASIARGEAIFNSKQFTITAVRGLNLSNSDPLGPNALKTGTCTTCHDSPNVGNHSKVLALDIGIADDNPPALDVAGLPLFTVQCLDSGGSPLGPSFKVTDLGRALISGKCADIGKVKGPILRGLSARAPYFHNGSAATFDTVVDFYNQRFNIGFTDQEKADLIAFLNTL